MHITNKYNLPQAFVNLLEDDDHGKRDDSFSTTTLLNNNREILLKKRHDDEIETDVSDMINLIFGTAVHNLLEKYDTTGNAEMELEQEILPGWFLTGRCDLYDEENHTLIDYKTASVWKVQFGDFEDWRKQGLIYAWMLIKKRKFVEKLRFYAILKDWTARDKRAKGNDYPESQVYTWEYKITTKDLEEIEEFIYKKFNELVSLKDVKDDDLPDCDDTWYSGDKYAVYKKSGQVRADRLLDTEQEAHDYITNKLGGAGVIEYRKGVHRKCQDYCNCCNFCKFYEERRAK